jgi:amino acid transporter
VFAPSAKIFAIDTKVSSAVEFVLAIIKIIACTGLILLGIIINCGGVPTQTTGYIGGSYWHNPGAFANGFKGFCAVFVNAVITPS